MLAKSRAHLAEAGETYFEHLRFALVVAALAIGAGIGCLIHAFVPALCEKTCSRTTLALQGLFATRDLSRVTSDRAGVLVFVFLLALSGMAIFALLAAGGLTPVTGIMAAMTLAIPIAFLLTNRELEQPSAA